jgi:hypothetical protein
MRREKRPEGVASAEDVWGQSLAWASRQRLPTPFLFLQVDPNSQ